MKNFSLQVFAAMLFCFVGTTVSARTYQETTQNAFTGANTYCQGDVANTLTFTYNTCNIGGGGSVGAASSITWYYNVTNSTALGTATIVAGPTAFNSATAATGNQTYTPSTAAAGTFYYFCVITRSVTSCGGAAGSTLTSTTQLVTINPLPTAVVASGGGAFCGSTTITAANGGSGTVYYQGLTSNGTSTVTPSSSQIVAASGTYYFRAQSAAGCWSTQGSVTVTINSFPLIFNVSGTGSYCAGAAGVDVQLSGSEAGVNYQLYNGAAMSGAALAGGATPLDFGLQTAGVYTVSATNATTGCSSNMTGSATITSDPLPIVYTVSGGGNYCSNGTGLFIDLSHSDIGINYQLYNGTVATGAPLPGAASAISFGPETAAGVYTVSATNTTTGCTNNMAGNATINVLPAPTQYTMTGGGGYCIGGAGLDIGLSNSDVGTNYQLYNGAATVGGVVPGNGLALDFGVQTVGGTYSVLATSTATGCTGPMANTVPITVNPLPTVYTVGGGGAYCMGGAGADITLSGSDVGVNYQTYLGAATAGGPVPGTGAAPTDLGMQTAAGTYTVVATDGTTGCSSNMNGSASVSINPLPAVFSMTGGGAFCAGGSGIDIGLSGSATGVNYQLYNGAVLVNTFPGNNSALDFGLQTVAGTYTVTAVDATTFCTSPMNGSATVTVNPLPTVYTISAGGGYCVGGSGVDLTLSGSDVGVNYQLYLGAVATGAPVPGTGAVPTDLGMQTAAGTYTVFATNPSTGCTNNMAGTATVTVNPLPLVFSVTGGGGYCAGGAGINVGLNGSQLGINYQLYDNGVIIGAPVPGTGSSFNFGTEPAAGTYTVVATNATTLCTSNMAGNAIVVINPLPTPYTVTGGGPYCSGGTGVHIGLSSSDLNISYQLYNGASLVNTLAGTGGVLDFGLFTAAGSYSVLATNVFTGCTNGMTGNAIITINPLPTAYTVTGGGTYCAGGAGFHVGLSNSDLGVNYQLYRSGSPVGGPVPGIAGALDFGVFTAAGNYLVVATNTATTCMSLMTGSATITINPLPGPISGTTTICAGSATTLTDGTAGGAWSSNDITIATISAGSGLMTGIASGITTITYTLPTTCYITAPVTVNALPIVAAITGVTNECAGSSNTLTDATATGIWSSTNPAIATIDVTGTVNGVSAGIATISYTVTNAFGCVAAATTPDTVNALPVVDVISGSSNVCVSSTATLSDDSTGGVWASSDISTATIDPSLGTITGVAAGTVNITYTVTSAAGCVTFVTTNETVNPLPAVTAISGTASVCVGLTTSLSDTTSGGAWSSSNNTIATVNLSGTVTGVAIGTVTMSYTITSPLGCANSATYSVTVGSAIPAIAILPAGSSTLCNGTPINLVLSPAGSGLTYQWSNNGTDISGATNASYMADSTGLFTVTLNNGTCSETITGVTIIAPPHPIISYNSGGNYLYTSAYSTYQWYKNGTPITGANSSILSSPTAGNYNVTVSDAHGCFVESAAYTVSGGTTIVNNTTSATDVKVYPNPATSTLRIDAPVSVNVTVMSPDGKLVIQQKEATNIDVSQLADGLYIIMIYDDTNALLKTEKFMKIK